MNIEPGWRFLSADFSMQATRGLDYTGNVILIRDPIEKTLWHSLEESLRDSPDYPLYVYGVGLTIEEAISNANLLAKEYGRINETK